MATESQTNIQALFRGVWFAKNDFGSVLQKNCSFRFGFGFTKLTVVSVFASILLINVLFKVQLSHDNTRNILDCDQSNYYSRIIFSCRLILQAAL